jgi:hypothetical protein
MEKDFEIEKIRTIGSAGLKQKSRTVDGYIRVLQIFDHYIFSNPDLFQTPLILNVRYVRM